MTLNGVIALKSVFSPNSNALPAIYVTVVEGIRKILSPNFSLPLLAITQLILQLDLSAIVALLVYNCKVFGLRGNSESKNLAICYPTHS